MIPDTITREDVLAALRVFDEDYRGQGRYDGWEDDQRFRYALEHGGKSYPPKQVIVLAGDIPRSTFAGGEEANGFLESRGFHIRSLATDSEPSLRAPVEEILDRYVRVRENERYGRASSIWDSFAAIGDALEASPLATDRPHLRVRWSAGQANWTYLPWIALFDERETATIQDGVYCAYLFREDMSGVYLTLTQGITESKNEHGRPEARRRLAAKAEQLRQYCDGLAQAGFALDDSIDLHTKRPAGIDYEHCTAAHKLYESAEVPSDSELLSDLGLVLGAYDKYLKAETITQDGADPGNEGNPPEPPTDLREVVSDFSEALYGASIRFGNRHEEVVRDFVVSLATKQLVILTGLSGSGKTQIALQFGRWLGPDRSKVIPVRPDWTGPESLFGYPNLLSESKGGRQAWHVPPALEFILEAASDPQWPYMLVLDEMNLAHVERYFADVISGMESGEPCVPNLVREEGEDGLWRQDPDEPEVPFPPNLFIAGTVNVDETTYMFSPKVLDRANTMEFVVESSDLSPDLEPPGKCAAGSSDLVRGFLEIARDKDWHLEHESSGGDEFFDRLRLLHSQLEEGFSFGHRVVFEATRFAALYGSAGGEGIDQALDVQVLQKVLPRLHGSRRRLEPVLQAVGKFCFDPDSVGHGTAEAFDPDKHDAAKARLPRSFDKVRRMTRLLRANQFVSFTE